MIDVSDYDSNKAHLDAYGYTIVEWADFVVAADLPGGLLERAFNVKPETSADPWVVYDPDGGAEDWLLVGDKEEISMETVLHIIDTNPPTGPLSGAEADLVEGIPFR